MITPLIIGVVSRVVWLVICASVVGIEVSTVRTKSLEAVIFPARSTTRAL